MTQVKINNNIYDAVVTFNSADREWNGRTSKTIRIVGDCYMAKNLFSDNVAWSIVDGEEEYDNSNYCVLGDITEHRDGTVSVKMGKHTAEEELTADLEEAYELLYGGDLA